VRRTAGNLARRLVKPLPVVDRLGSTVQWTVFAVGVLGGGTVLGIAINPLLAAVVVLLALLMLMTKAAWNLQREADYTSEASFECSARLEPVEWVVGPINGRTYRHAWVAWVTVVNQGPTSSFTARVLGVSGVPDNWKDGEHYLVRQPLWETPPPRSTETIEFGGSRRLKLAAVLAEPRAFWFYTSEAGLADAPGHQLLLGPITQADIEFTLEIVNTGDRDQMIRRKGRITVPANVERSTFAFV
jgi:hypothetical protein